MKCSTHNTHFTVYPEGFAPYQRCTAAHAIDCAATDAANGRRWVRQSYYGQNERGFCHYESTQRRWLEKTLLMLGLNPSRSVSEGEICLLLGISVMALRQARIRLESTRNYRKIGELILRSYGRIPFNARAKQRRLLALGHQAGLWGEPWYWEHGRLHRIERFQPSGNRDPPKASPSG